jgi:hypothetical protein
MLLYYKIMLQNWKIIMLKFAWSIKAMWKIKVTNHKKMIFKIVLQKMEMILIFRKIIKIVNLKNLKFMKQLKFPKESLLKRKNQRKLKF